MKRIRRHIILTLVMLFFGVYLGFSVFVLIVLASVMIDLIAVKFKTSSQNVLFLAVLLLVFQVVISFALRDPKEQIIMLYSILAFAGTIRSKLQDAQNSSVGVLFLMISMLSVALWSLNLGWGGFTLGVPRTFLVWLPLLVTVYSLAQVAYHTRRVKEELKNNEANQKELNWITILINLISHNVRTPLSVVTNNLELLRLKLDDTQKRPIERELARIDESVENSVEIMNRLLRASSMGQLDNYSGIEGIEQRIQSVYPGITVEKDMLPFSLKQGHTIAILMALEVFIDNAQTHGGDQVKVAFLKDRIAVMDNGKGMPKDKLILFGKPKSSQDEFGNMHGIGVSFAMRLLEAVDWTAVPKNSLSGFTVEIVPSYPTA